MQALEHSLLLPGVQATPTGHATAEAELLRQMLPADAGVEDEEDSLQDASVVERLSARVAKPAIPLGQQGLDPRPELIRGFPRWLSIGIPFSSTRDADDFATRSRAPLFS